MTSNNDFVPILRGGGSCHSRPERKPKAHQDPPLPAIRVATVVVEKLPMSDNDIQRGLDSIGAALTVVNEVPQYRIIGAGALWAMGVGFRQTSDFDILVPTGTAAATKKKLLQDSKFGETALKSTFLKLGNKNYNVDIIPHSRAHLKDFPSEEYPQYATSASIAPLEAMIESKIGAYRDSTRIIKQAKHNKDGDDLEFLFRKAVEKGLSFGFESMPGFDRDFVDDFRKNRQAAVEWLDTLTTKVDEDGDVEMVDV